MKTDIITRMEANQSRFGNPLWTCAHGWDEKGRCIYCSKSQNDTVFPSLLQSAEDERRERQNDLRYESLIADESEYGPRCNLRELP